MKIKIQVLCHCSFNFHFKGSLLYITTTFGKRSPNRPKYVLSLLNLLSLKFVSVKMVANNQESESIFIKKELLKEIYDNL